MIKQVIVIRKDLKMRRGKEIAQGSHASMAFLLKRLNKVEWGAVLKGVIHNCILTPFEMQWMDSGHTKVCLQVNSEQELVDIQNKATAAGLEAHLITDSGFTEFDGVPTKTCLAIGPDEEDKINSITGDLKLY